MVSNRLFVLLGIALLAFVVVACSNSSNKKEEGASAEDKGGTSTIGTSTTNETKVVKDKFGEVTVPVHPKKLLVTSSIYAEDLIEMGITPQVSLVVPEIEPEYRNPYLEKHGVEMVKSTQYEYNYEQLLSLSPDMIIVPGEGLETKVYKDLSKIAPTVALDAGNGMDTAVPKLGELFDKTAEADKVLAAYVKKAEEAKVKIHQAIGDKSVLVLRVEPNRYRYLGPKADDDISRFFYQGLGLKSPEIFKDTTDWFTPFSVEILPTIKPDYIFLEKRSMENADSTDSLNTLKDNPLWKSMDAVKNDHVFPLRTNDYIQAKGPIGSSLLIDYIVEKLVP